jgi:hypothetical protein
MVHRFYGAQRGVDKAGSKDDDTKSAKKHEAYEGKPNLRKESLVFDSRFVFLGGSLLQLNP